MKKTISLLIVFCLLTASYSGFADCSSTANTANCSSHGDDSDGDSIYYEPTSGLTMYVYAVVPNSGTAYAYVSWASTGPVSYYDYYPSAPHSTYYYDAYAQSGTLTLGASSTGTGSHAGASVAW
jgi:hypothetical protein